MQGSTNALTLQERKQRLVYLVLTGVPILGSYLFNKGFQISFLGCPLLRYIGIPCPAWGLTRSFMAVARGDFSAAIAYHIFGPMLFAAFLITVLHLSLELSLNQKLPIFYLKLIQNPKFQIFGFLLLLGYHGVRLEGLWRTGELAENLLHSPLGAKIFF